MKRAQRPREAAARRALFFLAGCIVLAAAPRAAAQLGAPVNVSTSPGQSYRPALAVDPAAGTARVVWQDFTSNPNLLWCAEGSGRDFTPGAVCGPNVMRSWEPAAAVDSGGSVHLVWRDRTGAQDDIYYAVWDGAAWSTPEDISSSPGGSRNPAIALDPQDNPHVVWEDDTPGSVVFFCADYDGTSWGAASDTGLPFIQAAFAGTHDLACDSTGTLHLVWQDGPDSPTEIYHAERPPAGPWGIREAVSGTAGSLSAEPAVAVGPGDTLYCAWVEQEPLAGMTFEVVVASKPILGAWSAAADVSRQAGSTYRPDIAVDPLDGLPAVVWMLDGPGTIYYAAQPGDAPVAVSRSGNPCNRPVLAFDGAGNPYVAWQEVLGGFADIFVATTRPAAVVLLAVPESGDVSLSWTDGQAPFGVLRSLTEDVAADGVELSVRARITSHFPASPSAADESCSSVAAGSHAGGC